MNLISLTLLSLAPWALQEPADEAIPSEYTAITDGVVHTVTDGVLQRATVLIKGDRILKIGERVRIPEGARIIQAKGMHVYPGLIAFNSSGIVSGRGSSLADSYDPYGQNVELALSGGITSVHADGVVAKLVRDGLDGVIAGYTSMVNMSYSTRSPGSKRSVEQKLAKARDFIRLTKAHQRLKAAGEESTEPSKDGVDGIMLALLKREKTARFSAQSTGDLLSICNLLDDFPMDAIVVGAQEGWVVSGRLSRAGVSAVVTPRAKRGEDQRLNRPNGWSIENAAKLDAAGVRVSIIPSAANISLSGLAGRDLMTLPMEAAFAMRGGLSSAAALRAVTLEPAMMLGVSERMGSLEVGKDADIIITDGDLFDYRSFVQWSLVNGKVAYDKATSPYFAHIRPRASDIGIVDPEVVTEAIKEVLSAEDEETKVDAESASEPDAPVAETEESGSEKK